MPKNETTQIFLFSSCWGFVVVVFIFLGHMWQYSLLTPGSACSGITLNRAQETIWGAEEGIQDSHYTTFVLLLQSLTENLKMWSKEMVDLHVCGQLQLT